MDASLYKTVASIFIELGNNRLEIENIKELLIENYGLFMKISI